MPIPPKTSYKAGQFWGLTVQKGPWKETPADKKRESFYTVRQGGGGVGIQQNKGNANAIRVVNPYTVDASAPPPKPSSYVQQSIVYSSDYKPGVYAVGRRKQSEVVGVLKKILKQIGGDKPYEYPDYFPKLDRTPVDHPGGGRVLGGVPGERPDVKMEEDIKMEDVKQEPGTSLDSVADRLRQTMEAYKRGELVVSSDEEDEMDIPIKQEEDFSIPGAFPQQQIESVPYNLFEEEKPFSIAVPKTETAVVKRETGVVKRKSAAIQEKVEKKKRATPYDSKKKAVRKRITQGMEVDIPKSQLVKKEEDAVTTSRRRSIPRAIAISAPVEAEILDKKISKSVNKKKVIREVFGGGSPVKKFAARS